jgi:hypothetical protein
MYIHYPISNTQNTDTGAFQTAGYGLLEYASPGGFFNGELGLRLDHLAYVGQDFTLQAVPVLNPRLNLDFEVLKNRGILDTLTVTLGTGLFSSLTDTLTYITKESGLKDFDLKLNRSWSTVLGTKFEFDRGIVFTLEGYYKSVFDRAYYYSEYSLDKSAATIHHNFDGEGRIVGFDFMLQKLESRYWDGWLSYSFNYARYRDPAFAGQSDSSYRADWYYPSFHRFHNINLVLNIKPTPRFNIYTRLGFASGTPQSVVGTITSYPVEVRNPGSDWYIIEKWKRASEYSDTARTPFSLPMDIKFSWYRFNPKGKVQSEIYLAVENVLWFVDTGETNKTFNPYTGKEEEGITAPNYGLPIPMISFGFKWSF